MSISSHEILFQSEGLIGFIDGPDGYSGTWDQSAGDDRLPLTYYEGASLAAPFDGYAVGDGCREGVTTFPGSPYVSPCRVCIE